MKKNLIIALCSVICVFAVTLCVVTIKKSKQATKDESGTTEKDNTVFNTVDLDFSNRDKKAEYDEDNAIRINFDNTVSAENGVNVEGNTAVIKNEGTYIVSGNTNDGSILIEATENDKIQLVLSNADLKSASGPSIYIKCADKVFITLEGENFISGGSEVYDGETTLDGAIFSKEDLTFNGTGSLKLKSEKHGIVSKDDLVIVGCVLDITAGNVCLSGKDCVKILGGQYTLNAGSDGIRSDNTEESERGFIHIEDGSFDIVSGNDGIQAETLLNITGGSFNIISGGGSKNSSTINGEFNNNWQFGPKGGMGGYMGGTQTTDTESAKALKATRNISITGGTFNIDCADDGIHANGNITVSGGEIIVASGDDGVHADDTLTVSDGSIKITKSYEGLEGTKITVTGGDIDVVASDDGFNAAGGNDQSSMGGRPGQNNFEVQDGAYINISGGNIHVNASGDGIDSNGSFTLSGGTVYVSGPTNSGNGAFDYGSFAKVTGGTLIATGSMGMATGFTEAENQGAMLISFSSQSAEKMLTVVDKNGNTVCSFAPDKIYQSAVITAPNIKQGGTYKVFCGEDQVAEITMSSLIYGSQGGMMPGGVMMPDGNRPGRR